MTYNDFFETIMNEYSEFDIESKQDKDKVRKLKRFCNILSLFAEQNLASDLSFKFLKNNTIYIAIHGMCSAYFFNTDYEINEEPDDIFTQLLDCSLSFRISTSDNETLIYEFIVPGI